MAARSKHAFSLVELLVVLGILAVLIALLLPTITRARKQALRVVCLSNLRQVGHALLAYAEANRGSFPAAAYGEVEYADTHWTLQNLGVPTQIRQTPRLMPWDTRPPTPPYPFSYTVNVRFTGYSSSNTFNPKANGESFGHLGRIVNPSEKAMMIEEDVTGINDGLWRPEGGDYLSFRYSSVSVLHDKDVEYIGKAGDGGYFNYPAGGRGNVVFADGHGEFFRRFYLQLPRYTIPNVRE
jgi:prepilin-type N-terminal cleavage/methylation domain-containing protein/prepilin-type processing-associated H-X9-DG protein